MDINEFKFKFKIYYLNTLEYTPFIAWGVTLLRFGRHLGYTDG